MEFTKYGVTETPKLIYNNPLASKSDIDGFVLEGTANISFPEGKLRMENGLSAAQGQKANYVLWCPKDFFDESLQRRTGEYPLYHHGDINACHVSYFRRKEPDERSFHTCNLRKSYGFYLVAQGADPIPDVADASKPYKLGLLKYENQVRFFVNDLEVFNFNDDGTTYGPCLEGGKIGFRQLAPMIGEYSKLKVYSFEN